MEKNAQKGYVSDMIDFKEKKTMLPIHTIGRRSATRHAATLFLYGGAETDYLPLRNFGRLSKITGVSVETLSQVSKEDDWEGFSLNNSKQFGLASLDMLRSHTGTVVRLEKRLDEMMDVWEECEIGSEKGDRILKQINCVMKLCGHDKRLAMAAKIEERIRLDQLKTDKPDDEPPNPSHREATGVVIDVSGD